IGYRLIDLLGGAGARAGVDRLQEPQVVVEMPADEPACLHGVRLATQNHIRPCGPLWRPAVINSGCGGQQASERRVARKRPVQRLTHRIHRYTCSIAARNGPRASSTAGVIIGWADMRSVPYSWKIA